MPCYEVRTVSIQFKAENIDLLKAALIKAGYNITLSNDRQIDARNKLGVDLSINFRTSTISSRSVSDEKTLTSISNEVKRKYSLAAIETVAQKQKWIMKKMADNRYQLQRF